MGSWAGGVLLPATLATSHLVTERNVTVPAEDRGEQKTLEDGTTLTLAVYEFCVWVETDDVNEAQARLGASMERAFKYPPEHDDPNEELLARFKDAHEYWELDRE